MKKIMLMAGILALVSCEGGKKASSVADLAGEWSIVEVNNQPVSAEVAPFLGFDMEGKQLFGNAGCNSLMGTLEVDETKPGVLSFGSLGSTKRMCADMATEDAVLQALGLVKGFDLTDGKLTLTDGEGKELMELSKR